MCSIINRGYCRDSLDRFGDDLCELILSYLPISDCFRLQCVCNQFKANIFCKQTRLTLSDGKPCHSKDISKYEKSIIKEVFVNYGLEGYDSTINYEILNYVMKRCVNINHIIIDCDCVLTDETITILMNTCKSITHLSLLKPLIASDISTECWKQFAEKCLQKLESLSFNDDITPKLIVTIVQLCPKIKKIYCDPDIEYYFDHCLKTNTNFGSNLESVHRFTIDDAFFETFTIFTEHFKHQLKSMSIWFYFEAQENDIELLNCMTKFENLEYLCCGTSYGINNNCIELLIAIGLKCLRLKVLNIECFKSPLNDAFISGFRSLETLIITSCHDYKNFEFLKNCVHLTDLKLYGYKSNGSEFKDIHVFLPQLHTIDIGYKHCVMREDFNDILKHLGKLANFRVLNFGCTEVSRYGSDYCCITADDVIVFIANCVTIRKITIYTFKARIDKTMIEKYIECNNRKIDVNTANAKFGFRSK